MKKLITFLAVALGASSLIAQTPTNARRFVTVDETGGNVAPSVFWSVNAPSIKAQLTNFPAENISGVLPVSKGGTGAADSASARLSLGLGTAAVSDATAFQPSSPALSQLQVGNASALTNLPMSGVVGLSNALNGKLSTNGSLPISNITGLQAALNGKLSTNGTLSIGNITGLQAALDTKLNPSSVIQISNVFGLQSALDGKLSSVGSIGIASVSGLQAALDGKLATNGSIPLGNVTGLQAALDAKLGQGSSIGISNVTGLQTALDGKLSPSSTISLANVSGLQAALDGKLPLNSTFPASSITNLQPLLDAKLGTNGFLPIANITGLQSALDSKLSSAGSLAISNIAGLQSELDGKLPANGTIQIANVAGLGAALDGKMPITNSFGIANVTGLQGALDGKLSTNGVLPLVNIVGLPEALSSKLDTNSQISMANVVGLSSALSDKLSVTSSIPLLSVQGLEQALGGKLGTNGSLPVANITGLQEALDAKLGTNSLVNVSNVFGLQPLLNSKLDASSVIQISNVFGLQTALDSKLGPSSVISIANVSNLQTALDSRLSPSSALSLFPAGLLRTNGSAFSLTNFNRAAVLPPFLGNSGKVLAVKNDESDVEWVFAPTGGSGGNATIDIGSTNATGVLPITKGGTGQTNATSAIQALLPSYAGNSNRVLALNSSATGLIWSTNVGGGTVSLSSTNATGVLPLSKGGTGATNREEALSALLPDTVVAAVGSVLSTAQGGGVQWVAPAQATNDLAGPTIIGVLPVSKGGTGGTNEISALAGLGLVDLQPDNSSTSVKLGNQAVTDGGGVSIGAASRANSYGVSLGWFARGNGTYTWFITNGTNVTTMTSGTAYNVAIGGDADAGHESVSVGYDAQTHNQRAATAVGFGADAKTNAIAVGANAKATNDSIQFGLGTNTTPNSVQVFNWGSVSSNAWNSLANMSTFGSQMLKIPSGMGNQVLSIGPEGTNLVWTTPTSGGGSGGDTLPPLTNNANRILTVNSNATGYEWRDPAFRGTVTSVQVSGGTTGLSFTGGPITTNGTITLSGTLSRSNGGTGGATNWVSFATNWGIMRTTVGNENINLSSTPFFTNWGYSTLLGHGISMSTGNSNIIQFATIMGTSAKGSTNSTVMGYNASAVGSGIAIGANATASGTGSIAIGGSTTFAGTIAIGASVSGSSGSIGIGHNVNSQRSIQLGKWDNFQSTLNKPNTIQFFNAGPVQWTALTRAGWWFDPDVVSDFGGTNTTLNSSVPIIDVYGNPTHARGITTNVTVVTLFPTVENITVTQTTNNAPFLAEISAGTNQVYTETFTNIPYTTEEGDFWGGTIYTNALTFTNASNTLGFTLSDPSLRLSVMTNTTENRVWVSPWPLSGTNRILTVTLSGTNVGSVGFWFHTRRLQLEEAVGFPLDLSINNGVKTMRLYPSSNVTNFVSIISRTPITNIAIRTHHTQNMPAIRDLTVGTFTKPEVVPVAKTNTFTYENGILTGIQEQ